MHQYNHSSQHKALFPIPNEPQPNAPYPNRHLPSPVNTRLKDGLSNPESSSGSSPSGEAPSQDSTPDHSAVNSVIEELGGDDSEPSQRAFLPGYNEEGIFEMPDQFSDHDKPPQERSLADMIRDLPGFDDLERNIHEAIQIDQTQRTLAPPTKPTAQNTDDDETDAEVTAFRDCIDQAGSGTCLTTEIPRENTVKDFLRKLMELRTESRKLESIDKSTVNLSQARVSEKVKSRLQNEARWLSQTEREEAKYKMISKIRHARKEKRRRQDHKISASYLRNLVPTFLLNAIDVKPNSKRDGPMERAIVLIAAVVWIILLVRLVTTLQSEIKRLHNQNAILLEHLHERDVNQEASFHHRHSSDVLGNARSSLLTAPLQPMPDALPSDSKSSYINYSTKGLKRHYAN